MAGTGDRIVGVDVARCLALLGMMATHVLAESDPDGTISSAQWLAGGRASALFAVLAGVSLALMTGGQEPVRGAERRARSSGLVVRAVLVAVLGLLLGDMGSGLAVILTYYGVLFLLGLPFLGLRARPLLMLAAVWVVLAPVASQVVRAHLPGARGPSPTVAQLGDPGALLSELVLTGYYPALPWLAYLLFGLALGRLDLRARRTPALLLGGGVALAVAATLASRRLTSLPSVVTALTSRPPSAESGPELLDRIGYGIFGTTPPGGAWEWLLVVAPHSATPFDLAQTIGSAAAVIGLCLLATNALRGAERRFVEVLFGAGAMTLTLYSLHVVMRTPDVWPAERGESYVWHVLVVLGLGSVYAGLRRRGPVEQLVALTSGAVARRVRGRYSPRT